jgi:hypothetical protein
MYKHEALEKLQELIDLRNEICFKMIEAEGEELQLLEIDLENVEDEIGIVAYQHGLEEYDTLNLDNATEA